MYYSAGTYEAFAHPEKPKDVDKKSAYIIGTGLAGLTAAFYLVRDGQMKGEHIVKSNMVYTLCKHMVYMLSITNEHKNELEIRAKPEWKVHFLCFASAKRGSFSIR
jgi:hypothetical protein